MKYAVLIAAALFLLATGVTGAQAPQQKPAAGASAQGQAGATAGSEGASATGSATGAAAAQAGQSSANVAQGTEINATLTRPVDSGKAKPGDPVEARAAKDIRSNGAVVVPRGSRLVGRVTKAQPRGGGSAGGAVASELGIVFDHAILKNGSTVALNGAVAALGAAQAARDSGGGASGYGNAAGSTAGSTGGLAGGIAGTAGGVAAATTGAVGNVGGAVGGAASAAARSPGAVGGLDIGGGLRSGSRGVFGLRDLRIAGTGQGSAEGSVISSTERNVRLEGGTQMLIVAGASAGKAGQTAAENPGREKPDNH